jgi:hypothetical protein
LSRNDEDTSSKNEKHKCSVIIVKIAHVLDIVLADGVQRSFVELQWTHLELFKSFKMDNY